MDSAGRMEQCEEEEELYSLSMSGLGLVSL